VGLEGYENRLPHHLSEGEKKKAAIATVLSIQPEILIVDEPTANLDPKSREELIELITNLSRERKSTLVIATHDVDISSEIADRMFVLNKGRILTEGTVKEVFSQLDLLREARLEPPSFFRLFCTMA
jgi:cobalt/nickel transport system ATP-binding protein